MIGGLPPSSELYFERASLRTTERKSSSFDRISEDFESFWSLLTSAVSTIPTNSLRRRDRKARPHLAGHHVAGALEMFSGSQLVPGGYPEAYRSVSLIAGELGLSKQLLLLRLDQEQITSVPKLPY